MKLILGDHHGPKKGTLAYFVNILVYTLVTSLGLLLVLLLLLTLVITALEV